MLNRKTDLFGSVSLLAPHRLSDHFTAGASSPLWSEFKTKLHYKILARALAPLLLPLYEIVTRNGLVVKYLILTKTHHLQDFFTTVVQD